jgi:hypothetical protein
MWYIIVAAVFFVMGASVVLIWKDKAIATLREEKDELKGKITDMIGKV